MLTDLCELIRPCKQVKRLELACEEGIQHYAYLSAWSQLTSLTIRNFHQFDQDTLLAQDLAPYVIHTQELACALSSASTWPELEELRLHGPVDTVFMFALVGIDDEDFTDDCHSNRSKNKKSKLRYVYLQAWSDCAGWSVYHRVMQAKKKRNMIINFGHDPSLDFADGKGLSSSL